MQPAPVPLYPGSSANLFSTVFHFQSSYNRSTDGSWPAEEPGKLEKWIVLSTAADAKQAVVYAPEDQQEPGYWNVDVSAAEHSKATSAYDASLLCSMQMLLLSCKRIALPRLFACALNSVLQVLRLLVIVTRGMPLTKSCTYFLRATA